MAKSTPDFSLRWIDCSHEPPYHTLSDQSSSDSGHPSGWLGRPTPPWIVISYILCAVPKLAAYESTRDGIESALTNSDLVGKYTATTPRHTQLLRTRRRRTRVSGKGRRERRGETNCWHRVVGQVVKLVPWVKFVQCDYGQTIWPMETESKEDMGRGGKHGSKRLAINGLGGCQANPLQIKKRHRSTSRCHWERERRGDGRKLGNF